MNYVRFDIPEPLRLPGLRHIDVGQKQDGAFVFAIDQHLGERRDTLNDGQRYDTQDKALAGATYFLERRKEGMEQNNGNHLTPVTATYDVVDQMDDQSIIAMMTGNAVKDYVYSFKQGGKTIEGLTLEGINEAANRKGGIEVDNVTYEEREHSWLAIAKATDTVTGCSRYGAYEQSKTLPNGKVDPHAFTKAIHKAQRNAIKQLLPVPLIKQVIDFYLHGVLPAEQPPNGENQSALPDPDKSQREAFAVANELQPRLDEANVTKNQLWNYVRKRFDVMSRKDMTEQMWVELVAELRGADSALDLLNELVTRIKAKS